MTYITIHEIMAICSWNYGKFSWQEVFLMNNNAEQVTGKN